MMNQVCAAMTAIAATGFFVVESARGGYPASALFFVAVCGGWFLLARHGGGVFDRRPGLFLFFVSLAVYLSTFRWHGGDDLTNSLIPFCILRHGTLALDPFMDTLLLGKENDFTVLHGGSRLSIFPIAPAILALPLYLPAGLSDTPLTETFLHYMSKAAGALITAAAVGVFHAGVAARASPRWALALSVVYAFGSWSFSLSSQALWQSGPAQLGLALGLWGLGRPRLGAFVAGVGFGLATASRPDHIFFLAAAGAWSVMSPRARSLAGFCCGAAIPLGASLAYWLAYTGSPLPPEWAAQTTLFPGFQREAVIGLLASPQRGFIFFFPPALFGVWAALRRPRDPLKLFLLAACLAKFLLLCCRANWIGGESFGPRYFSGTTLILLFFCADIEGALSRAPWARRVFAASGALAVIIHAVGAYFSWPGHGWNAERTLATLWDWSLHPLPSLAAQSGALRELSFAGRYGICLGLVIAGVFIAVAIGSACSSAPRTARS